MLNLTKKSMRNLRLWQNGHIIEFEIEKKNKLMKKTLKNTEFIQCKIIIIATMQKQKDKY